MEEKRRNALEPMLYLCATPIGNLEDITLRVVRVLESVSRIYCEDTRHTAALLNRLEIKKPLVSCHEHNEKERAEEIIRSVHAGEAVAGGTACCGMHPRKRSVYRSARRLRRAYGAGPFRLSKPGCLLLRISSA